MMKADNELDYLENGVLEDVGPVWKVRGYAQKGEDVEANYDILGLCSAIKSDGTIKQIAVANGAANSDAYTFNPVNGQWTPHNLSLTTAAKAEFEYFLDGWFMVNFSDATRWNNFVQWYTNTNVTDAPKAKYIKLYLSRLYLGYVSYDGTTYTSRVVYSDLPSGSPMTITWTNSVNYFDVDQDDSDVIKGLEVNANRLLIFKEHSLHRYDTNTLYKVSGAPGTVSQRTVKNIQGWTLYLHSSGIWGFNGETSQLISRQIKDIIEGVATNNLSKTCAWVHGDHYYLYLSDINNIRTGLTISKCLIDYDISKNAFTWRSLNHEPTDFVSFTADTTTSITYNDASITYNDANTPYTGALGAEKQVFFGDTLGAVYQLNTGNTYDGSDIPFQLETKYYYLGNPSIIKTLYKLHVFCDGGRRVVVQYQTDEDDWKTLGRLTKTHSELIFPSATKCYRVKFRITESSAGKRFYFEGFDIYFVPEGLIE